MAEYSLTLSALKYANVTNFSRPFGTKKTALQNSGSLTTEEFNIANALPFDIQRPLVITETSTISNIQYDAKLLVNGAGITVTLGTAVEGITVTVATLFNTTVNYGSGLNYTLKSGDVIKLIYFNSQWNFQIRAVDDTPTVDSPNLITSGAVAQLPRFPDYSQQISIPIGVTEWTATEDCYIVYNFIAGSDTDRKRFYINNHEVGTGSYTDSDVILYNFMGFAKKNDVIKNHYLSIAEENITKIFKLK